MSYGTCQSCLHWTIGRPLETRGTCALKRHRRHGSARCPSWRPLFREIGALRKAMTKDYRDWLRLAAIRRLFGRGKIDAITAASLLKDKTVMDGWAEYLAQKKAAGAVAQTQNDQQ